ncbi:hypothetical Protein YC6258_02287 [Gynuella sunshinyii YC6258]|uniref:Uncharacterized protein n=1 Tax=Gynuella sunshinyii YC6258 TaxID=1445510 RepID=A0A0C5V4C6_9GAMM|nr:hypothetical Protein YC6258_02287 [Gynuella sunshinyii YC6258]
MNKTYIKKAPQDVHSEAQLAELKVDVRSEFGGPFKYAFYLRHYTMWLAGIYSLN